MSVFFGPSVCMICSALSYSLQYLDLKTTGDTVWQSSFWRGVSGTTTALILHLLWISRNRNMNMTNVFGEHKMALHTRGVLGGIAFLGSMTALYFLDLCVATTFLSLSPIWTGCCYYVVFYRQRAMRGRINMPAPAGEPFSGIEMIGVVICVHGLLLIGWDHLFRNDPHQKNPIPFLIGALAAGGSTFCQAIVNLSIRSMSTESPPLISLYPMLYTTAIAFPGVLYESIHLPPVSSHHWMRILAAGVLAVVAQLFRVMALQRSKTIGVMLWRFLDVPFSIILDRWVLGTPFRLATFLGVLLVTVGCVMPPTYHLLFTTHRLSQRMSDEEAPVPLSVPHPLSVVVLEPQKSIDDPKEEACNGRNGFHGTTGMFPGT